jgi:tetratricopeptide (TPR) repeat protein
MISMVCGVGLANAAPTSEASVAAIASLNAGTAAIQSGRALEAIDYLNSAIESNALSVEGMALAYHHRAIAHQKLGLSGHAIADYTSAIWQGGLPSIVVPRSYYNRAVAYAQMGQQDRAARDYDKAIELAPDYAAAYHNRGNLRRHMEQYAASISDYSRALELGMERKAHLTYFARALSYNELGNRAASLQDAALAIELKPDFTVARQALAEWGSAEPRNSSVAEITTPTVDPIVTASIAPEPITHECGPAHFGQFDQRRFDLGRQHHSITFEHRAR